MPRKSTDALKSKLDDAFFTLFVLSGGGKEFEPIQSVQEFALAVGETESGGLVLYTPPQRAAAPLLVQAEDPAKTLENWRFEAEAVLAVCRPQHNRILIAERPETDEDASQTRATIEHTFPGSEGPILDLQPVAADRCGRLAATVSVLHSFATQNLLGELQARSAARFEELPGVEQGVKDFLSCHIDVLQTSADQLHELKSRLHEGEGVNEELRSRIDVLQTSADQLHELKSRLHEGESVNEELRNRIEKGRERERIMALQIGELEDSLRENDASEQRLRYQNAELTQEMGRLKNDKEKFKKQIEKLKKEKTKLEDRIDMYRTSISWRMTAPIRVGKRLFNRIGGGG